MTSFGRTPQYDNELDYNNLLDEENSCQDYRQFSMKTESLKNKRKNKKKRDNFKF